MQESDTTEIDKVLETLPKVDSITAQLLLREAYEITYGIFDHSTSEHPWDLVLNRKQETVGAYSALSRTLRAYRLKDVKGRFGLSITEFLDLPRETVNEIFQICDEVAEVESKAYSSVERDLGLGKR